MHKTMAIIVAAAMTAGTVFTSTPAAASMAVPATPAVGQAAERAAPGAEKVQFRGRRHYRSGRHYRGGRHAHRQRQYHRQRHHRRDSGAAAAAGIIGFAAGAILGSAMQQGHARSDWHAYCASKYRSYDPRTGTYLGYDGRRHYCR